MRDVAPCFDCGGDPKELQHLAERKHVYIEVLAFHLPIILCDFCLVDFSSYDPEYFNRRKGTRLDFSQFTVVRELDSPKIEKDKFCEACGRRLAFLRFVAAARDAARDREP